MMRARLTAGVVVLVLSCAFQAFGQQPGGQVIQRLSLPNKDWAVDFPSSAFTILVDELKNDGREYSLFASQKTEKWNPSRYSFLRIRLMPSQLGGGPTDLRDFWIKNLVKAETVKSGSLKTWEYNQIPVARYTVLRMVPEYPRAGEVQIASSSSPRSMEAYFVKDDVWITLSLTASPFEPEEEKLFYSLLDSVKIVDTTTPTSSFDYYQKGRLLFMQKEYKKAAEALAAALSLEQQQRRLDIGQWRDLVGKLTDSYGATSDRARAKEVLEYGISNDPANQTFYMGLARLYATLGDVDNTIASLQKAFFYMKKNTPHMPLPDLKYDSAFSKMMMVDKFREALKAMRKQT
jgi:tetratricopeptide (TPR) repeat protein